ncbi:hypothetical protein BC833DRAFT_563490 [Globomyces pollinis-pini]|nr:hypothetical protein BC833DRAFT_563490 [Globomyces pollinis-pini]
MNFFTLAASLIGLVAADHLLEITLTVDNAYFVEVTGQATQFGPGIPVGTPNAQTGEWGTVQTKTFTLLGDGPWVVGVVGDDWGVTSAFMGVVKLNGGLLAVTGDGSWDVKEGSSVANELEVPAGWLDPDYDANANGFVTAGYDSVCLNQGAYTSVKAQIGNNVKPIWRKGGVNTCASYQPNALQNYHYYNYFRLVIPAVNGQCNVDVVDI